MLLNMRMPNEALIVFKCYLNQKVIKHVYFGIQITANIPCIQFSFCLLGLQFYFINYVIISCELAYDNSLNQRMYAEELQIIQSKLEILTVK